MHLEGFPNPRWVRMVRCLIPEVRKHALTAMAAFAERVEKRNGMRSGRTFILVSLDTR